MLKRAKRTPATSSSCINDETSAKPETDANPVNIQENGEIFLPRPMTRDELPIFPAGHRVHGFTAQNDSSSNILRDNAQRGPDKHHGHRRRHGK